MIFQSKIDRAMKWLNEKNHPIDSEAPDAFDASIDPKAEWLAEQKEEKVVLEKGDLLAIILSALLVFGPVFLVFATIAAIAYFSMR